ncbi:MULTISPECIES: serpin family protein [Paenibacillus]|uniref:Serpin family protein n=1 Tax=Paenibacillus campinasensis TaxID=66347 RepID=A0ABW9SYU6_9BACL|nr:MULTISPECIES: serpin family protein [Paenibacillus]MUG66002.1 serpin family protein [Paenibacillus campinasensis]PAK49767.1 proteinase inhibitor I4 serpin [Paenibacillus sp. 7541]
MGRSGWAMLGLAVLLALTACGGPGQGENGGELHLDKEQSKRHDSVNTSREVPELTEDERKRLLYAVNREMIEAQNRLGLSIHQQLVESSAEPNVMLSPYSITAALALAYNGSAGMTQEEMAGVLGWSGMDLDEINENNRHLKLLLEQGGGVLLNVANSVWHHQGVMLQQPYISAVRDSYGAEVRKTDLTSSQAVEEINSWVEEKTRGKISEILDEPPNAAAMLINAVYFNGNWKQAFDPSLTVKDSFKLPDGKLSEVQMMQQEERFAYKESEDWQAVRLPYGDGRMEMLILLPSEQSSLDIMHTALWENELEWREGFGMEKVDLALPKFKLEASAELSAALEQLGMRAAFQDQAADFSRMADNGADFFIGRVQHKVYIDVHEAGTEAAAVTGIEMQTSAAPPSEPVIMHVDRPFFFAIEDRDTGAWLFMGSVNQP